MPKFTSIITLDGLTGDGVFHFENGWTVIATAHQPHCAGFLDVPTHIYAGPLRHFQGYCEAFVADPKNKDKAHNSDTELVQMLARIAQRPPIGPAKDKADEVASMIRKAVKK